jgi:hypothetical protein
MALFEDDTHVFIVRIWLECRDIEGTNVVWRGVIEHVTSGERRYVKDLDDLVSFIAPYFEKMGLRLKLVWRVKRWLTGWKRLLLKESGPLRPPL